MTLMIDQLNFHSWLNHLVIEDINMIYVIVTPDVIFFALKIKVKISQYNYNYIMLI